VPLKILKNLVIQIYFIFLFIFQIPYSFAALLLLSRSASLSAKNSTTGSTPLHIAAAAGSAEVWTLLVEAGADLNCVDNFGKSPVDVVFEHGWGVSASDDPNACATAKPAEMSKVTCKFILPAKAALPHSSSLTAVVTNDICRRHFTCPPSQTDSASAPPENINRLSVLLDEQKGKDVFI
jgi:ankyrin repeat protein